MTFQATLGLSDKIIQGQFDTSYFIQKYSKSSQFSTQIIPLQFNRQVFFGEEATIDVYQEADILKDVYIQLSYPSGQPSAVCDSFGTYILNWAQLEYGDQLIERIDGEFLEIVNDLTIPQGKQGALSNLLGKNITSNLAVYYIKLPFSILEKGLPVCALQENPRIRLNIRNFWEGCPTASQSNPQFSAILFTTYVFLPEAERNYFINNSLSYLYENTQRVDVSAGYSAQVSVFTEFENPVKELFFVIQDYGANAYVWTNTTYGAD